MVHDTSAEKRLWTATLLTALTDAIKSGNYRYFDTRNPDFLFVASMAGENPRAFVAKVQRMRMAPVDINRMKKRTDNRIVAPDYGDMMTYDVGDNEE